MEAPQQNPNPQRRPFCHRCTKPLVLCLCSRLKYPPLDNSIAITVLQHSLEKDHPLNSTRVATLGLRNLAVVHVTDTNFKAQFLIRPIHSNQSDGETHFDSDANGGFCDVNRDLEERWDFGKTHFDLGANGEVLGNDPVHSNQSDLDSHFDSGPSEAFTTSIGGGFCSVREDFEESLDFGKTHFGLDENGELRRKMDFEGDQECVTVVDGGCCNGKKDLEESLGFGKPHFGLDANGESQTNLDSEQNCIGMKGLQTNLDSEQNCIGMKGLEESGDVVVPHFEHHHKPWKKSMLIKTQSGCLDLNHSEDGVEAVFDKYRVIASSTELKVSVERTAKPDISWVLETPMGRDLTANGFRVSKLQRKQLRGIKEFVDFEEMNIVMPPGAALLFPSGKSVISVTEVDFEVKHLVVLDGTWAKAQRMYHENPWLKLLPHIKLDIGRESLYSEVRHQPKAGCLSTVESIVCALKALGNDMEGLDELLDVFESMIADQRRCKYEKFKARSVA